MVWVVSGFTLVNSKTFSRFRAFSVISAGDSVSRMWANSLLPFPSSHYIPVGRYKQKQPTLELESTGAHLQFLTTVGRKITVVYVFLRHFPRSKNASWKHHRFPNGAQSWKMVRLSRSKSDGHEPDPMLSLLSNLDLPRCNSKLEQLQVFLGVCVTKDNDSKVSHSEDPIARYKKSQLSLVNTSMVTRMRICVNCPRVFVKVVPQVLVFSVNRW